MRDCGHSVEFMVKSACGTDGASPECLSLLHHSERLDGVSVGNRIAHRGGALGFNERHRVRVLEISDRRSFRQDGSLHLGVYLTRPSVQASLRFE